MKDLERKEQKLNGEQMRDMAISNEMEIINIDDMKTKKKRKTHHSFTKSMFRSRYGSLIYPLTINKALARR